MRSRLRRQFYCDHCKKSGASRFHMEKHERGCTNNPDRVCGVCAYVGTVQQTREALTAAAGEGIKALRELAESCPACMLTGVRTWLKAYNSDPAALNDQACLSPTDPRYPIFCELSEWKYAEERRDFWADVSDANQVNYAY